MKGINKEDLIKILKLKNYDFYLEQDLEAIFKVFGDDYFYSREDGKFELCKKNDLIKMV
jgi:hypothetical protein